MNYKIISAAISAAVLLSACDDNPQAKAVRQALSASQKIDYTFDDVGPFLPQSCKGFGCVYAEFSQPGGRKTIAEKYDGKTVLFTKYMLDGFDDNFDTVTYNEMFGIAPCVMSAEEAARMHQATGGRRGFVQVYGTLHIGTTDPVIQPCYFKQLYECTSDYDEFYMLCLKKSEAKGDASGGRKYIKPVKSLAKTEK